MNGRFTVDGSPQLEARVAALCQRATEAALRQRAGAEAILLGGGYGRGEGGVLRENGEERLYNDVEFYVCLKPALASRRRARAFFEKLSRTLSSEAGVHVEFKLTSLGKLRRSAPSLFLHDLAMGHRWALGEEKQLAGLAWRQRSGAIPLHEATRLLMNRASGLLFSKARMTRQPWGAEDADFVGRNVAKAQLALGDAVLIAHGLHHGSCRERHRRIEKLAATDGMTWWSDAQKAHLHGVEFKLHPRRSAGSPDDLLPQWSRTAELARSVWLWLESRRLEHPFANALEYAVWPRALFPESERWKNALKHSAFLGANALWRPSLLWRDPRERLCRALALLLWRELRFDEKDLRRALGRWLDTPRRDWPGWIAAYERLWNRFQ